MSDKEPRDAARKAARKINDDLTRQMFGAYTNAPERPEPSLSFDTLQQTIGMMNRLRAPSMEIHITEHIRAKDGDGPIALALGNRVLNRRFQIPPFGPDKTIIMHPQTFLDNISAMPTDIPIYGYEVVARWIAKKKAELLRKTWPTLPARYTYLILTAVMLLIILLIAG